VLQQRSGGLIGFDLHATETASPVQGTPFLSRDYRPLRAWVPAVSKFARLRQLLSIGDLKAVEYVGVYRSNISNSLLNHGPTLNLCLVLG